MRFAAVLLLSAFLTTAYSAPVQTDAGLVEGASTGGLVIYKGIPYAAPPVGNLRWRDPQPVTPWSGVRDADHFSPACMQTGNYPPDVLQEHTDEDCLYLNLWKPDAPAGEKRPVMVWIYGGGLDNGSGSVPLYAGDALAKHGVIVITFNYRLGVFGFLAHPELSRESPHHSSGDYGLLDQIAALKWVQRNIAAFGGDPQRVTVFGQSSGSISISALTASPLAHGLFQRAIGESGGLFEPMELLPNLKLAGAEQDGVDFATHAGARSLQELRAKPAAELEKVDFGPALIVDGYAIPRSPIDMYRDKQENPVSVLIGSNANEGRLFLTNHKITAANYAQELDTQFPPLLVKILAPAPGTTDLQAQSAAAQFNTDMRFRWDMWTWANLVADETGRKVFLYQFDRVPPYPAASRYAGLGATHGMEMAYVFGHLDPDAASWTAADRRLSGAVASYWTNFAKTGDPNGPDLPTWSPYTAAKPALLNLDSEIAAGPVHDENDLRNIGRLYATARFVLGHIYLVSAATVLLLLLLITGLVVLVRRWLRRRCAT